MSTQHANLHTLVTRPWKPWVILPTIYCASLLLTFMPSNRFSLDILAALGDLRAEILLFLYPAKAALSQRKKRSEMTFSHKQMVKFPANPCHLWMLQRGQMAADEVPSSRKWYKVVHVIATNRCFARLSPAMTSSKPLSLHASSSDCGCRLELVTATSAPGLSVSLSSLWRRRKWISPTACAHISHLLSLTWHHSCKGCSGSMIL